MSNPTNPIPQPTPDHCAACQFVPKDMHESAMGTNNLLRWMAGGLAALTCGLGAMVWANNSTAVKRANDSNMDQCQRLGGQEARVSVLESSVSRLSMGLEKVDGKLDKIMERLLVKP